MRNLNCLQWTACGLVAALFATAADTNVAGAGRDVPPPALAAAPQIGPVVQSAGVTVHYRGVSGRHYHVHGRHGHAPLFYRSYYRPRSSLYLGFGFSRYSLLGYYPRSYGMSYFPSYGGYYGGSRYSAQALIYSYYPQYFYGSGAYSPYFYRSYAYSPSYLYVPSYSYVPLFSYRSYSPMITCCAPAYTAYYGGCFGHGYYYSYSPVYWYGSFGYGCAR